jgi:hypothetical protein
VKLSSWPEIRSDGDVLLTPYVPKGITGYDDDDDDDDDSCVYDCFSYSFSTRGSSCKYCENTGTQRTFCSQIYNQH